MRKSGSLRIWEHNLGICQSGNFIRVLCERQVLGGVSRIWSPLISNRRRFMIVGITKTMKILVVFPRHSGFKLRKRRLASQARAFLAWLITGDAQLCGLDVCHEDVLLRDSFSSP